eukprot:scaffold48394_cov32-Tisochrysis_lutea.AAC.2
MRRKSQRKSLGKWMRKGSKLRARQRGHRYAMAMLEGRPMHRRCQLFLHSSQAIRICPGRAVPVPQRQAEVHRLTRESPEVLLGKQGKPTSLAKSARNW